MDTTAILLLLLLPICPDLPADADPASWQSLKDTSHLLEVCRRDAQWSRFETDEEIDDHGNLITWETWDFGRELRWVHGMWRTLYAAPPLADAHRWPSQEHIAACTKFNFDYQEILRNRKLTEMYRSEAFDELLTEACQLAHVWELAYHMRSGDAFAFASRRLAMIELRGLIGPENYYAGRLPPHVPLRWFTLIPGPTAALPDPEPEPIPDPEAEP